MDNIIQFPDKNAPNDEQVYTDTKGVKWFKFSVSYHDGEDEFTFNIWATSMDDAQRRMKLLLTVTGQILAEGE